MQLAREGKGPSWPAVLVVEQLPSAESNALSRQGLHPALSSRRRALSFRPGHRGVTSTWHARLV